MDSQWQPIETAPKDGAEFQAWINYNALGFWEPKCRFNLDSERFEIWGRVDFDCDGWDAYNECIPTHWMPIPPPPKETDNG